MKVLIVEDKKPLADAISDYLKLQKIECDICNDGLTGYEHASKESYDVMILDLMLPEKDGLSVIKDLRANKNNIPILVLTAKSSTDDKVECLLAGADDYVTKPFVLEELLARLYVMTRRKNQLVPNIVEFGDLRLDKFNHTLNKDENSLALSMKEYQILEALFNNTEGIVDKAVLLQRVWGNDADTYYNSVEVYISFIRRKLEALNSNVVVKSIRNVGYKLVLKQDE
jgi:response regulator receiver domain protein